MSVLTSCDFLRNTRFMLHAHIYANVGAVDLALQELKRTWKEIPGIIGNWNLGTDAVPSGSDRKDAVCCHQQAIKL